jgi:hypothetical protein
MLSPDSADLATLARARVFFAHQSVGANVLEGVRELADETGTSLPIVEMGAGPLPPSGIVHVRVGRNGDPQSKVDAFVQHLDGPLGDWADVALLKYCYVDLDDAARVGDVFGAYASGLAAAARRRPGVRIVPVTLPLRHAEGGLGVWARERLGRPNRAKQANLARHAFNERVRHTWVGSPLFDLARAEATRPDGRRQTFTYAGATAENLVAGYTDDGGHLNTWGRRAAAVAFVRAVAHATRHATSGAPP